VDPNSVASLRFASERGFPSAHSLFILKEGNDSTGSCGLMKANELSMRG
jgi:hypothetical protein